MQPPAHAHRRHAGGRVGPLRAAFQRPVPDVEVALAVAQHRPQIEAVAGAPAQIRLHPGQFQPPVAAHAVPGVQVVELRLRPGYRQAGERAARQPAVRAHLRAHHLAVPAHPFVVAVQRPVIAAAHRVTSPPPPSAAPSGIANDASGSSGFQSGAPPCADVACRSSSDVSAGRSRASARRPAATAAIPPTPACPPPSASLSAAAPR